MREAIYSVEIEIDGKLVKVTAPETLKEFEGLQERARTFERDLRDRIRQLSLAGLAYGWLLKLDGGQLPWLVACGVTALALALVVEFVQTALAAAAADAEKERWADSTSRWVKRFARLWEPVLILRILHVTFRPALVWPLLWTATVFVVGGYFFLFWHSIPFLLRTAP